MRLHRKVNNMNPFLLQILLAAALMTNADTMALAATTDDPNAVFFSKKVLQGALSDIARMQEPELRAFARYLSECDPGDQRPGEQEHACAAAYLSYQIEFGENRPGQTRPIDDLMVAIEYRKTKARMVGNGSIDMDRIAKEVEIISSLEDSARARFRALRTGGK